MEFLFRVEIDKEKVNENGKDINTYVCEICEELQKKEECTFKGVEIARK